MRLISTINRSIGFRAKIYYNSELSEYICKFYNPEGEFMGEQFNYYTSDKDDAIGTAHLELDSFVKNELIT